ncbi:hypothetical protein PORCAN_1120 [Porphyromonas crevioricanis JCM 13913]|nr:hypothetical protein PORCAN_1120 [Porphyromonas crevioricanis JCM 13913]
MSKSPNQKDLVLVGLLWVQISPPNRSQDAQTSYKETFEK